MGDEVAWFECVVYGPGCEMGEEVDGEGEGVVGVESECCFVGEGVVWGVGSGEEGEGYVS